MAAFDDAGRRAWCVPVPLFASDDFDMCQGCCRPGFATCGENGDACLMSLFYPATTPTFRRRRRIHWPAILTIVVAGFTVWTILRVQNLQQLREEQRLVEVFAPNKAKSASKSARSSAPPEMKHTAEPLPAPVRNPFREFWINDKAMPADARNELREATRVLREALTTRSPTMLEPLVRHPEITIPRLRTWNAARQPVFKLPLELGPKFGITEHLLVTTFQMADGGTRHVVLERRPDGYRIDWEGMVGWCEVAFDQIGGLLCRPPAVVRVQTQPSMSKPPFTHAEGLTFILSHPSEELTLLAHAPQTVMEATKAGHALKRGGRGQFTLRITVDEESLQHGWVRIQEVICSGWVADL
ncbi:MAG: hypothetical protein JNG86_22230 [Verrucomicrobiaceae bacterium]|nr:hypothetical protein [Verrucomicrobiaceae bacterium]